MLIKIAQILPLVLLFSLLAVGTLCATGLEDEQLDYLDGEAVAEPDYSLFRLTAPPLSDLYGEYTRYLHAPISLRRRGVDFWQLDALFAPASEQQILPLDSENKVRLTGANRYYRLGGELIFSRTMDSGWSFGTEIDLRLGRDGYFEGLFRQDLYPSFTLARISPSGQRFGLEIRVPISQSSSGSATSAECYALSGDNSYNPSWGLYHGKVRSANVTDKIMPRLDLQLDQPLGDNLSLKLSAEGEYGTRARSRVGWYDAYNPLPDNYRRLPSYLLEGEGSDLVRELWAAGDVEYTQIAWDRLESYNELSADGNAHYVVEREVERRSDGEVRLLFESETASSLSFRYGASGGVASSRYYKVMDDLLGADYLLDIDQYVGDEVQVGNDMQNDLQNPNRKITEGDRFGYDYTLTQLSWSALFGASFRGERLDVTLDGALGERYITRVGHYQKERFADNSLGSSELITLPSYSLRVEVGYALAPSHYLLLRGELLNVEPYAEDLFIQAENSNQTIENPEQEALSSLSLGYRYRSANFSLQLDGYMLTSRNGSAVWQSYDDLSGSYADNVITNISTRSLGVELTADWSIVRNLDWRSTLSVGGYQYIEAPEVTLYNDVDLSLISTSSASGVLGCLVGNAPQLTATSSLKYLLNWRYIFSIEGSFAGMRYIEPSLLLRTDRVLSYTLSDPSLSVVEQERLGDIFDLNLSIVRLFYLERGRRVVAIMKLGNLLSNGENIYYAREGNRLLSHYSSSSEYVEASRYSYCYPRNFYLSLSYNF